MADQKPSIASRIGVNIAVIALGLATTLAAQVVIWPLASFIALAIGSAGTGLETTVGNAGALWIFVGVNVAFQLMLGAVILLVAILAKRLWLLQGYLVGAIIGLLLYTACWGVLFGGG